MYGFTVCRQSAVTSSIDVSLQEPRRDIKHGMDLIFECQAQASGHFPLTVFSLSHSHVGDFQHCGSNKRIFILYVCEIILMPASMAAEALSLCCSVYMIMSFNESLMKRNQNMLHI